MSAADTRGLVKLITVHCGSESLAGPAGRGDAVSAPVREVLSVPDLRPADCGWPEPAGYPSFARVDERWFTSEEHLGAYLAALDSDGGVWHYRVEEFIRKDEQPPPVANQRRPGVKEIFFLTRPEHRTRDEFADHWLTVHHPLALRHHVGMCKYVQNVVVARLSEAGPDFDGVAELHYPSLDDARDRRYDNAQGRAVIAADRPNFVGGSIALFTGEVTVRSG